MFRTTVKALLATASLTLAAAALAPAAFAAVGSTNDLVLVNYSYCEENPEDATCLNPQIQPHSYYQHQGTYRGAVHERGYKEPMTRQHG